MRTRNLLILTVIMIVTGTILWFMISPTDSSGRDKKSDITNRYAAGPVFKPEGKLCFVDASLQDTLACLTIEIADNYADIRRGLMDRSGLNKNTGMFFIFDREEQQIFWMKNTRIALDIVFVNQHLKIVHIAKHTIPYSEEPVMGNDPSKYVVEVQAGYCDANGISTGNVVRYDVFENETYQ